MNAAIGVHDARLLHFVKCPAGLRGAILLPAGPAAIAAKARCAAASCAAWRSRSVRAEQRRHGVNLHRR